MGGRKGNRRTHGEEKRFFQNGIAVDGIRTLIMLTGFSLLWKYPLESLTVNVVGFLALFGLQRFFRRENEKINGWAAAFAVCYAAAMVLGREMWTARTVSGLLTVGGFFRALLCGLAVEMLIRQVIQWTFAQIGKRQPSPLPHDRSADLRRFLAFWGIILLAWMPCYLAYYPGINAYDLEAQTRQVLGIEPWTTQHPPLHTAMWALCIWIGDLVNVTGYAIYGLGQMMILSAAMAAAAARLWKRGYVRPAVYGAVAFFALNPAIAIMSFNPTKDIVFAAVFLVYLTFLPELLEEGTKTKTVLGLGFLTALCCLLRNNAIYSMGLTLIVLLLLFKKAWKRVLICHLCGLLAAGAVMWGAYPLLGIGPGNKKEAMSVPMQQIARILLEKREELGQETLEEIAEYYDPDQTVQMYNPRLSEPVKDYCFSEEALRENMGGFLRLWGKLVVRYPGIAVDAFLDLHLPYWYPEAETIDAFSQRSYIETIQRCWIYGLVPKNLLPGLHAWYESVADFSLLRRVPVLNTVFSIQLPLWLLLFCFCLAGYRKRLRQAAGVIPAFFYWLFFLLAPGSNFRYIFPLMTAYPLLLCHAGLMARGERLSTPGGKQNYKS